MLSRLTSSSKDANEENKDGGGLCSCLPCTNIEDCAGTAHHKVTVWYSSTMSETLEH